MQTPTLQHFEIFLQVAHSQSFTAAAQQLAVSKAAVSNSIRTLEESLQTPLFIRTTRRISLTEEGQLLLAQCERLKYELDAARNLVTGFNSSPTGTLRISCNPYYSGKHLFPLLDRYMQAFPDMQVDVYSEERMPDMQAEQIDIVFGVNWPPPLDIVRKRIATTRYVICASPDYLKKHGTPNTIKELENHRYIPHLGRNAENIVAGLKHQQILNLQTPLKINNANFMKQCALNGTGIIQLHDYSIEQELKDGRLVEILKNELENEIPLYVYYQKHRFVQPKIRQFIRLIGTDTEDQ